MDTQEAHVREKAIASTPFRFLALTCLLLDFNGKSSGMVRIAEMSAVTHARPGDVGSARLLKLGPFCAYYRRVAGFHRDSLPN